MAVYVSLVPCAGSEDNARFFCSRQTAQISAEVREGLVRCTVLRVCHRYDKVERLVLNFHVVGETAVYHGFHLRAYGIEVHGRRQCDNIRRFERLEGALVPYVHGGGRIGVLVRFETENVPAEVLNECGKDVAMQIAALNPAYLDKSTVPAEALDKEKEILMAQIQNDPKNSKKPQNIIEKMVTGRIGKFYENNCLLQQAFVKNGDLSVEQYIAEEAKKAGGTMKVTDFVRFEKGEGLEKRNDDFASEVANMVK